MDYPKKVPNVGLVNGKFIDEDNDTGLAGSLIPSDWGNAVTDELLNVIQAGGLEPDEDQRDQLLDAIRVIVQKETPVHTTLAGYGITDAYTKLEVEERLKNQIVGQYKGLTCSASGLDAQVKVAVDQLVVGNGGYSRVLNGLDLSFSGVAEGANGLDSGLLAALSWYSVWVIWNGSAAAGLLSLSATTPKMPSGYTHKARVGWVRTDASANKYPLGFIQRDRHVQYRVLAGTNVAQPRQMASGVSGSITVPTWTVVSVSAFVPVTAITIKIGVASPSSNSLTIVAPNAMYGSYSSTSNPPWASVVTPTGVTGAVQTLEMLLEGLSICWASSGSGNSLYAFGYEDSI